MNATIQRVDADAVLAYSHPELVKRLAKKLGLREQEAEQLFSDVKRFLYVCGSTHTPQAPPPRIDDGWHEFLMYTKDYARFCSDAFGRFIHHTPTPESRARPEERLSEKTRALAAEVFGDDLSNNWNLDNAADPCDGCGQDACTHDCSNEA